MLSQPSNINKHVARFLAILTLYSHELQDNLSLYEVGQKINKSYRQKKLFDEQDEILAEMELHAVDETLFAQLISLANENKEEIENSLKENLIEKYRFDRLDRVIRAILKLATLEILYCGDTPTKIILDEYVSLTKTFYESNEVGFVNKVVDVIARSVRGKEI